ncbi:MAG: cobalamin biosynthesis protein CbiX [Deltaproteobacteria bacterium]|nr:MAG: cobalamin biosynthesis protein CbiX [Deltaproteobacteria bacterium]
MNTCIPTRLPTVARQRAALVALAAAAAACTSTRAVAPSARPPAVQRTEPAVAFLVVAPDRGFLGNEEVRDAVAKLEREHPSEVVFVTDERTRAQIDAALARLRQRGATRMIVLPLFITEAHPRWALARALLRDTAPDARVARRFGASYLAVEALADQLRRIDAPAGRRVVVVGYGATDEASRERMTDELERLARTAAVGFGFADVRAVVWHEVSGVGHSEADPIEAGSRARLRDAVSGGKRPVVVPFHLGKKLDGMMTFDAVLRRELPDGVDLAGAGVTPHPAVSLWLRREANRATLTADDIGVVVLAHGSDFDWNETMRAALADVTARYPTEFAFCMADQPIVERAIRRLEARGARGIVIVRVFGMASSFRATVERMIGLDVEDDRAAARSSHGHDAATGHGSHGHGHAAATGHGRAAATGHGGHVPAARAASPPPRIRSAALITTVGGLEDHPLFAKALAERARELSRDPARETIILVAHGAGDDARNEHWVAVLESLARQMRDNGAGAFRAVEVGTWREDWPGKREPWVARIRALVRAASAAGGRAIVVPARTNGRGPARELLAGLEFDLGHGFAPHPLFARWVEEQIREGRARLLGATSGSISSLDMTRKVAGSRSSTTDRAGAP